MEKNMENDMEATIGLGENGEGHEHHVVFGDSGGAAIGIHFSIPY